MLLTISKASKKYGQTLALHPIDLQVQGEILGVIGNNGAGKSTLMKMIVGLLYSEKGKILVGGEDVRRSPETVKQRIGYLPESPLIYPKLTPEEFLSFVAEIRKIQGASEEIDFWLDTFGLQEKRNALLNDLSFGMKKKIAISAALLGHPPLLILDEPFNGLDVATMETLSDILLKRHAEGTTILISSHLMTYIDRLCHRVVILKKGKVVSEGSPAALKKTADRNTFHDTFLYFMGKES
ncbi:MAG: ABC transporter ATP-binding protein [Nitrospiria bacterium]